MTKLCNSLKILFKKKAIYNFEKKMTCLINIEHGLR